MTQEQKAIALEIIEPFICYGVGTPDIHVIQKVHALEAMEAYHTALSAQDSKEPVFSLQDMINVWYRQHMWHSETPPPQKHGNRIKTYFKETHNIDI